MLQTITTNCCRPDYKNIKYYNTLEEIKQELIEDIVYYHDFNGNLIKEMIKKFDPWAEEIAQDLKLYRKIKALNNTEEMNKLFEELSDSYYLTKVFKAD